MACCRPSTIAKAHLGSSAYTILIAKTCAQKQSVDARDVRCLATRAREALIYKEIASWAARNAFPKWQEGRHPHCHFRGLLRLHSRYGPPDRSAALRRPLSRGSRACGRPPEPLVSYRINRQLSGWNLPPLMIRAFGAHCQQRASSPCVIPLAAINYATNGDILSASFLTRSIQPSFSARFLVDSNRSSPWVSHEASTQSHTGLTLGASFRRLGPGQRSGGGNACRIGHRQRELSFRSASDTCQRCRFDRANAPGRRFRCDRSSRP